MDDEQPKPSWRVSTKLRDNARKLRRNLTDAERLTWSMLRSHRLSGAAFKRQAPIGPFIVDFICHRAKLVIEIDGGQHFSDGGESRDTRRTAYIESKGFRVVRFSNYDVLTNRDGVLETIVAALKTSAPTLTLPRKRERGQTVRAGKSSP